MHMGWNNRVVKRVTQTSNGKEYVSYGVHEVYYGKDGKESSMTTDSMVGYYDSVEDMIESLELILKDIKTRPIFEVPEEWKDKS
jgi:hypothetical protein